MKLSQRVLSLSETGTVAISTRAAALAATGRDIVNLGIGAPDFDTPTHAAEAAIEAIRRGDTRYTPAQGLPVLREAIRTKFARDNRLTYADDQLTIGTGGKQVILNLLLATLDPGDEVIVPAPYYSSYPDIVRLAGGVPVIVPCDPQLGFKLQPEQLEAAMTNRTRWLAINSPSNPCGAVYSRADLARLAEVLRRHPEVLVLSDEIYEHCLYTGEPYTSFAALDDEMCSRTATVNGVSKTYAMTGWRIGFAGGPTELMRAATKVQGQSTTCPSAVGQVAAAAALAGPQDVVAERRSILRRLRDDAAASFSQLPGFECPLPDGALYLYADCSGLVGYRTASGAELQTDIEIAQFLLEEAGVSTVPGAAFGTSPYLRITFSLAPEKIARACERIDAVLTGQALSKEERC